MVDGVASARLNALAALPRIGKGGLGISNRINNDAHVVHHQGYRGPSLASATETQLAGWRVRAATAQSKFLYVPFGSGNRVFAQQMNVIEISNVAGRGVQFNQGMIGTVNVGKEEAAVSSFAIALIADVGDRCLKLC